MMGEQSKEAKDCQLTLEDCTNILQAVLAFENQLNSDYTPADLEKFTQERAQTFDRLKLCFEIKGGLTQENGVGLEAILDDQLDILKQVAAADTRIAAKLVEEIENTRTQLSHCQRVRAAVQQYKARGNQEALFIDKQR